MNNQQRTGSIKVGRVATTEQRVANRYALFRHEVTPLGQKLIDVHGSTYAGDLAGTFPQFVVGVLSCVSWGTKCWTWKPNDGSDGLQMCHTRDRHHIPIPKLANTQYCFTGSRGVTTRWRRQRGGGYSGKATTSVDASLEGVDVHGEGVLCS